MSIVRQIFLAYFVTFTLAAASEVATIRVRAIAL